MSLKRSHDEFEKDNGVETPAQGEIITARPEDNDEGWQTVTNQRSRKRAKKLPRKEGDKYPSISFSSSARPQTLLGLGAFQNLVLYLLADGSGPQWCSIQNHANFRKVVVIMVPGLEMDMFDGKLDMASTTINPPKQIEPASFNLKDKSYSSPDDFYPKTIDRAALPASLQPLKDIFEHVWPIKTPGDDRHGKMHSPLTALLSLPVRADKDDKAKTAGAKPPNTAKHWHSQRVPITTLLGKASELLESGFVLHPAHFAGDSEAGNNYPTMQARNKTSPADGWKDSQGIASLEDGNTTAEKNSTLQGRSVLAIDCEMCITSPEGVEPVVHSLTRMSVIDWEGKVVLDELVKPKDPITNYLTPYSGITAEMMATATTTLEQAQEMLLAKLTPHTIIVGHSLESDLNALKITHPFIVDTAILYPHPRGPPLKSSLKWLAQKYLNRKIQEGHGSTGHNSVEDALASLDLVKQKCEKGLEWGTSDATTESIFQRIGRQIRPKRFKRHPDGEDEHRVGAVVDWGDPKRGYGAQAKAAIPCQDDADVAKGVVAAVSGGIIHDQIPIEGVDLTWARFRELEAYREWWPAGRSSDLDAMRDAAVAKNVGKTMDQVVGETVAHIAEIWQGLPSCTALIVYSGSGDVRRLSELSKQKQKHKEEYAVKKWDELTVRWTDKEEQELRRACEVARRGIGFIAVK